MNFDQAKEIMQILYDFYPHINRNKSESFNKTWLKAIMQGDYERTMTELEKYCFDNKFPPTIADFVVKEYVYRDDGMAEEIREAEETVKRELADPERAKRRQEVLERLKRNWQRRDVDE